MLWKGFTDLFYIDVIFNLVYLTIIKRELKEVPLILLK